MLPKPKTDLSRMFFRKVFILCSIFSIAQAIPLKIPKQLSSKTAELQEPNDDYVEKMAEIFGLPITGDDRVNLDNCENIICMPYYLCIDDMVVTNGTELLEWRISTRMDGQKVKKADQLMCNHMEMPCCADEGLKNDPEATLRDNENIDEIRGSPEVDYDPKNEIENENEFENEFVSMKKCGYRNRQKTATRIVGGDEAQQNEFPWMVAIFSQLPTGSLRYIGGGSLIHESVILTAAHLLLDPKQMVIRFIPEQLTVRTGEHDILSTVADDKRQERNVTNIIAHEKLYAQSLINDIALIVLDKPFKLTEAVNTICLPPPSIQTNENVICTSSGWGKNASGAFQSTLKKVDLPIVERRKCENLLRKTRLGRFYSLDESLICAGGGRRDTCKGDGGSPLICEIPYDKHRFYQTGIVAGGIGCGRKVPGIYVNLAHFSNWISQQFKLIDLNLRPENVLQYDLFD